MASTSAFYMPASKPFWSPMAKDFDAAGLRPTVWLGDWRHDDFAHDNFPDAHILPLSTFHTSISARVLKHTPSAELMRSRAFLALKNQAIKLMDRQDETRFFGRQERDAHFYSMFNHLYSVIVEREIDVLIAGEAPHHTAQLIGYRICEMLGIPRYHLVMNTFAPLLQVNRDIVGDPIPIAGKPDVSPHIAEIQKAFEGYRHGIPTPLYMATQARYDSSWSLARWALRYWMVIVALRVRKALPALIPPTNDTGVRARYTFEKSRRRWLTPFRIENLRRHLVGEYRRLAQTPDLGDDALPRFVYFPMPFEPERTSLPDGGDFYDAMDTLLAVRAYLPDDVHIFVKEHPSQFSRMLAGHKGRSQLNYQVIANLPNVRLIDLSISSAELTKRAEFTAVISGTAALEAALIGRKGVVFGSPWFARLPGVTAFHDLPPFANFSAQTGPALDDIIANVGGVLEGVTVPGTISVSQRAYMKQLFGDRMPELVDDDVTRRIVVATIAQDFAKAGGSR